MTLSMLKLRKAGRLILEALGEDVNRVGLVGTPDRFARLWEAFIQEKEPECTAFDEPHDAIIARRCQFLSMCEHHLVPFSGSAYIAYLPGDLILGMSKLDRIVKYFAGRIQLQERLTDQIAEFIDKKIEPRGIMVQTVAVHYCAEFKNLPGNFTISKVMGLMKTNPDTRREALDLFRTLREEASKKI